jgi:hypothetical protein
VRRNVVQSLISLEIREQIKALRVFIENGWYDEEESDRLMTSLVHSEDETVEGREDKDDLKL